MREIRDLILLRHPSALYDAISSAQLGTPEEAEDDFSFLLSILMQDDVFNGYSVEELQAAIEEAITEY